MIMDTGHAAKADIAEQIPADEALEMIHKITQKVLRRDEEV